ncbi:hypothetical protein XELAEV_18040437mg [Xenopus laevis]|uniref:G-protein coupled receptors family 1 profile domain-containing protein n=1 Tax=Xenopus laevis TaxID=8355 RepID=A0A974C9Q8_XENLA|nr:hypothetical protein XELAEV_18040437mg [Xenopus laevis]
MRINEQLQTPMYLLLSNLSILDIFLSSAIVPRIMINTLSQDRSVLLVLSVGGTESLILAVMAYDRYAAICQPLHYNTVMNKTFCISMATGSWTSFISAFLHMPSFFRLSCQDTWANELDVYITASIIVMCSFLLTLISYIHIISTILKILSSEGRKKSFSTCTSHCLSVL